MSSVKFKFNCCQQITYSIVAFFLYLLTCFFYELVFDRQYLFFELQWNYFLFISNFLNYIFESSFQDIDFIESKREYPKKVEIQQKNLVKTVPIIECVELGEKLY